MRAHKVAPELGAGLEIRIDLQNFSWFGEEHHRSNFMSGLVAIDLFTGISITLHRPPPGFLPMPPTLTVLGPDLTH
jgi:hypothetical protein